MQENTKRRCIAKIVGAIVGCIVLITLIIVCINRFMRPGATFNGSRIRGEEIYMLDFTILNGSQEHSMKLEKDEELHCKWSVEKGTMDVLIGDESGNKLYQGNKVENAEFDLTVTQSGKYTITVTGDNAKGMIEIRKK